ncbi:MAG: hypothetical protein QNJ14_16660 [Woeseiaceae bacterium]|nr:hypothetical protein [Woeseiaceae bacterium]
MPELTAFHIALLVVATVIGAIIGSVIRGKRAGQEKVAIGTSWQEQIDAQRKEHERLLDQNKALMEQVSQFQASTNDAKNRAKELSSAVQEAFERRDELQREIKDIRGNLETALTQRDQLQTDIAAKDAAADALREKDERIDKLSVELANWRDRLPPLVERFRERNADAERLEAELAEARARIQELEQTRYEIEEEHTRIEPVTHPDELTDGHDASNDPAEDFVEDTAPDDSDKLVDAVSILEQEGLITNTDDTSAAEELVEPDEPSTNDPDHDARDDLKQIKGVGPAIEKTLNEMGIFSFRQIAEMSEYDIDRVAQRLKGFRSRIYREDWIGQARDLRDQAFRA